MSKQLESTRYYLAREESGVDVWEFAGGVAAVYSRRHPFKTTTNEDAAVLIPFKPDAGVIAIADGCGGMAGGEQASRLTVKQLAAKVQKSSESDASLRSGILDGIEQANRKIRDLGTGAASTLSAVEIDNRVVRPYHIGDSTVLLTGNRGKIKLKTTAHSPVGYAVESGMLDESEAIHHEDRHYVSNVVGSADTHIEIGPKRAMAKRDTLLVGSDGLFDNLQLDEIVELARKGPIADAAQALVDTATARMNEEKADVPSKPDDLSIILFRLAS